MAAAPAAVDVAEQALLAEINRARAKAGLAPLSVDSRLQAAARAHTANLLVAGAFTHDFVEDGGPVGFSAWIRRFYAGSCTGENLASGSPSLSPAQAVQLWLASPGHRANMLSTRFTAIGVALDGRNGSWVATADFGC